MTSNDHAVMTELTVLLVEDEPRIREELTHFLKRLFGTVHTAEDGNEGMQRFTAHRPDIIVTDIVMPHMDGLEMIRAIHQHAPDVSVVVTTALDSNEILLSAIDAGVDGIAFKPIDPERLQAALVKAARIQIERRTLALQKEELSIYQTQAEQERRIVAGLMRRMMEAPGLDDPAVEWWLHPCHVVGGDMVAVYRNEHDQVYAMLADSTGHNLPAAINLLPILRIFYSMAAKGFALATIVNEIHHTLCLQSPIDRFVAATLILADPRDQVMQIWNGGNPPAIFIDPAGSIDILFESDHLPLGVPHDDFSARCRYHVWRKSGDLVLCSDGVLEATDTEGDPFGLERLLSGLTEPVGEQKRLRPQFDHLIHTLNDHLGKTAADDDMSLLRIRCPSQ